MKKTDEMVVYQTRFKRSEKVNVWPRLTRPPSLKNLSSALDKPASHWGYYDFFFYVHILPVFLKKCKPYQELPFLILLLS